jgi:hypothetical protein
MSSPKVYLEGLELERSQLAERLTGLEAGQGNTHQNHVDTSHETAADIRARIEEIGNMIANVGMPHA